MSLTYDGVVTLDRITVDPARMGGAPCIRDLRITVDMVLGQLAAGLTVEEVLELYPYLEPEDIIAAAAYAERRGTARE